MMKHCIRTLWLILFLGILAACGGESLGTDTDTGDTDTSTPPAEAEEETLSLTLSLVDNVGNPSTEISDSSPLQLQATLTDASSNPVQNEVISFAFDRLGLAVFSNTAGSAQTNSSGLATIGLTAGATTGSATITATLDSDTTVVETISFTSLGIQATQPASLEILATSQRLSSSGADQVEIIAIVKDENNILLTGVPVSFAVDQNASLSNIDAVTGDDGTARASLGTQNEPENRDVTITVTVESSSSTLTETLEVEVDGTEISIDGPGSLIIGDTAPITILLTDSDGNGIANEPVTIDPISAITFDTNTTDFQDSPTNQVPLTNSQGVITADFTANSSGSATISVSALNNSASGQIEIPVQQDQFTFSVVPSDNVNINENANLTIEWLRNNAPFVGGDVVITTSRGDIVDDTLTTDASGLAVVTISSAFAGPSSISAIGTDGSDEVTARANINFVATVPDSIAIDATPDLIGPDGQTATISAIVRDASGNLVEGVEVNFTIEEDNTGGSISPNTATTDDSGTASTVYTSNTVSSDNGIRIRATSGTAQNDTTMTVGNRAFDIVLGTGREIESPDAPTYLKEFAVFVTDASGRPISDAELTVTASPPLIGSHRKGSWFWVEDPGIWVPNNYDFNPINVASDCCAVVQCNSEDLNENNRLDDGEDLNTDGELTPGNVAAVGFKDNIARTNEFGQATIEIRYPKQFGFWSTIDLTVSGQSLGTESQETQAFQLGIAASDLTDENASPPDSPFGVDQLCESPD